MITDEQIRYWWANNPGLSDAQIYDAMQQYGVTPLQFAKATGSNASNVNTRYIDEAQRRARGSTAKPTPKPAPTQTGITDQQIRDWWSNNQGLSDAQIYDAMRQYGVTPQQFAKATSSNATNVNTRYIDEAQRRAANPQQPTQPTQPQAPALPLLSQPTQGNLPGSYYPESPFMGGLFGTTDEQIQAFFQHNPVEGMPHSYIKTLMDQYQITPQRLGAVMGWDPAHVANQYNQVPQINAQTPQTMPTFGDGFNNPYQPYMAPQEPQWHMTQPMGSFGANLPQMTFSGEDQSIFNPMSGYRPMYHYASMLGNYGNQPSTNVGGLWGSLGQSQPTQPQTEQTPLGLMDTLVNTGLLQKTTLGYQPGWWDDGSNQGGM